MDNSLDNDISRALLPYTRHICACWDMPLEQEIGLMKQYLASNRGNLPPSEAPYPPPAANLPNDPSTSPDQEQANNAANLVASTPVGLQSGVPATVNPESGGGGGFSPQMGSLGGSKFAEYNPLWVNRLDDDDDSRIAVEYFSSEYSFDDLFRFRVIKPQDALVLHDIASYHRKENGHQQWESAAIRLTVLRYSQTFTPNKSIPDFDVTILNCPELRYPEMKACGCLEDIMKQLEELDVTVSPSQESEVNFWHKSQVFRGDQDLGSLDWVRSAFNAWQDLQDGVVVVEDSPVR